MPVMGESHVIIRSVYKKFNTKFQNISHNIFTYLTNVADYQLSNGISTGSGGGGSQNDLP